MTTVAIVLVGGSYLSAVYGIKDILEHVEERETRPFDVRVVSPEEFARVGKPFDIAIVPPFRFSESSLDEAIVRALTRAASEGTRLCSVCAGAFYLCATGIADGHPVATHWNLADGLARAFPKVTVRKERVLIDRGTFITSGGITSYQDLALYLIRQYASLDAALSAAGVFLINPEDRSQLQYVSVNLADDGADGVTSRAIEFMKGNFARGIGLSEVADHCGVTVRTLLRRFRAGNLGTPGEYLQSIRLRRARDLLASGARSVKAAAAESGYADIVSFSRAFRKYTGLTPGEYARRFRKTEGKTGN